MCHLKAVPRHYWHDWRILCIGAILVVAKVAKANCESRLCLMRLAEFGHNDLL